MQAVIVTGGKQYSVKEGDVIYVEKLGVEEIDCENAVFDPEIHYAVAQIEDENLGENTVAQVMQKGYKMGDKVIRHAMVSVANCK